MTIRFKKNSGLAASNGDCQSSKDLADRVSSHFSGAAEVPLAWEISTLNLERKRIEILLMKTGHCGHSVRPSFKNTFFEKFNL